MLKKIVLLCLVVVVLVQSIGCITLGVVTGRHLSSKHESGSLFGFSPDFRPLTLFFAGVLGDLTIIAIDYKKGLPLLVIDCISLYIIAQLFPVK